MKKFPEFDKSIVVLDGDARGSFKGQQKPKLCFLPGKTRPENVIYEFIESLSAEDHFWDESLSGYNKQVFTQNMPSDLRSRDVMKKWFNDEKEHWGKGSAKL
ncbi:MAG: hypothetical protein Q9M75_07195, partial [Ghiorsea sp.]|nr:hypothetical protein [Ghiorsea sp.]